MKIEKIPVEFKKALPIIKSLEEAGFEAYFVGGSVRDILLGKAIHDVDIATSAYPEEVKSIFPRTVDVGIEHGTVLVLHEEDQYEITTFRTESTYQDYRRPDQVTFVRSLSEDLKRRDFTINALAMNQVGEIVDLFEGIKDLESQLIRAVGVAQERFNEDALRMMRALRFASQLDFKIEKETLVAIADLSDLLSKISIERIHVEFVKLMLGKNRVGGLLPFIATNCFNYCPGFVDKKLHLQKLAALPNYQISEEAQVWLLVLHMLEVDPKECRKILSEWKLSNAMIKQVTQLLVGLNFRLTQPWNNQKLFEIGLINARLIEQSLCYFDKATNFTILEEKYQNLAIKNSHDLAVDGKILMNHFNRPPGPWIGKVLAKLETEVVVGNIPNEKIQLLDLATRCGD
ncbi:CCA tRNA nucleotidyltransferase [Vagococcus intermedius]|uniref:CCA-adding enzyme n=1 Tax=Vagococcus intermedius TaxID=2991418 RepID=A0AAF0CWG2_9ENTE|nr:CCA tRNA nucleotidyltransferase [Vagococcus intermedius]WEG74270.1 CCA tRNA nucleotidyltransferase [Vagococcus intermedius]WEG76352.1 CCA tRNA nucleotidyltransferase [Vagococcus intermedius]